MNVLYSFFVQAQLHIRHTFCATRFSSFSFSETEPECPFSAGNFEIVVQELAMITLIALAAHVVVGMSDYCVDHAADGSVTTECAVPTLTRKQERWLYSKVFIFGFLPPCPGLHRLRNNAATQVLCGSEWRV